MVGWNLEIGGAIVVGNRVIVVKEQDIFDKSGDCDSEVLFMLLSVGIQGYRGCIVILDQEICRIEKA
jgi:hypothetical protein